MKIICTKRTGTGFTVSGDNIMLKRGGTVYPTIDNLMHPNPGTEADGYAEIERTIDWLYRHNLSTILSTCNLWLRCRVANELLDYPNSTKEDIILNVLYSDLYDPCNAIKSEILSLINQYQNEQLSIYDDSEIDELSVSRKIANWLNENFLRVRAGGKFNPDGANSIYFRISSHGYDWHRDILDFLWDIFGSVESMPNKIWIGHDAETNPPEITLFDGTPEELFMNFDDKIFASYKSVSESLNTFYKNKINESRTNYKLQKYLRDVYYIYKIPYISFK